MHPTIGFNSSIWTPHKHKVLKTRNPPPPPCSPNLHFLWSFPVQLRQFSIFQCQGKKKKPKPLHVILVAFTIWCDLLGNHADFSFKIFQDVAIQHSLCLSCLSHCYLILKNYTIFLTALCCFVSLESIFHTADSSFKKNLTFIYRKLHILWVCGEFSQVNRVYVCHTQSKNWHVTSYSSCSPVDTDPPRMTTV